MSNVTLYFNYSFIRKVKKVRKCCKTKQNKNDRDISKRHKAQFDEAPTGQI